MKERYFVRIQMKHRKSLFSDKPDPSCHADRLERKGLPKDLVVSPRRKLPFQEVLKRQEDKYFMEMLKKKRRLEAHDLQELARENAETLFRIILEIASNEEAPPAVRLQAANMGLDRAFGKAATTNFNVNADIDTKLENLDDASIRRRIAQNLARLEAGADNDRKTIEGEARPINLREYN